MNRNIDWKRCAHCRWWSATERTDSAEWLEAECHKRAPRPNEARYPEPRRAFPIVRGDDGCGDHAPAGPEVYRADYREQLGPWIKIETMFGTRRGGCECPACKITPHWSSCAVHNAPAFPVGPCDCGAIKK